MMQHFLQGIILNILFRLILIIWGIFFKIQFMPPSGLGDGSVVVGSLFIVTPIVCVGSVLGPCFVIQYFMSG